MIDSQGALIATRGDRIHLFDWRRMKSLGAREGMQVGAPGFAIGAFDAHATATSRIIERIAPLLGVAPQDENSRQIEAALQIESLAGKKIEDY